MQLRSLLEVAMAKKKIEVPVPTPDFQVDRIPTVRIKSILFKGYKAFENYKLNFCDKEGDFKDFICFIGPNGSGKSTVLYAIQLLFNRFEGYEASRIENNLSPSIRHIILEKTKRDDFQLTAMISVDGKLHEIIVTKKGFKEGNDHPESIKDLLYRICYLARFDQELHKFQLIRDRWPRFKALFEAVTGYAIEENVNPFFTDSDDPHLSELLKKYVLDFEVHKTDATISHKECSDGERKIIKSFSTLLNLDYVPQIILVDNIEMHVERSRHLSLIRAFQDCFPDSQIFSTTHSYYLSKVLGRKSGIYDMRLSKANAIVKKEPWRLRIIDELDDAVIKLMATGKHDSEIQNAKSILSQCYGSIKDLQDFENSVVGFLSKVTEIFVREICFEKE